MAEWKKVLLAGDAAELSTNTPAAVGTSANAGSGTMASKDDHVHILAVGSVNASNLFGAGVVDSTALGADAVSSGAKIADGAVDTEHIAVDAVNATHIDETATDITFSQVILTPKATAAGTAEGTMFYDSDDNHVYVYVV